MNPSPNEMATLMISTQLNYQKLNSVESISLAKSCALLEIQTSLNAIRFLVIAFESINQFNSELYMTWSAQVEYWKAVKYRIETQF